MSNKTLDQQSAVVIFSGGQDSTTCLVQAIAHYGLEQVHAVSFRYGQRHELELQSSLDICQRLGVKHHRIITLEELSGLTENALMNQEIKISQSQDASYPNTFVPGRNALFILYSAIYAYQMNIANIIIGVSQADYSGYPDCREEFIRSINASINLAMDQAFTIQTPLMYLDKAAVWELSDQLGYMEFVRKHSHTCYEGKQGGCKCCPSCLLREQGLKNYLAKKAK